jgi:hypothetical protein
MDISQGIVRITQREAPHFLSRRQCITGKEGLEVMEGSLEKRTSAAKAASVRMTFSARLKAVPFVLR